MLQSTLTFSKWCNLEESVQKVRHKLPEVNSISGASRYFVLTHNIDEAMTIHFWGTVNFTGIFCLGKV